ncbi:hypothetical protein [Spirosoma sp. KNUC1025]|uniref:hypothetical protein n=1 Tax=Spirosoma sp. KNUC1025 TaxID=2894082 RepID=UPI00386D7CD0|nr:hypothetical protein LN737_28045 [Spirosoma sp. KNUC1025]
MKVSGSSASIETFAVQYYQALHTNVAFQVLIRWQMDNKLTELGQRLATLQNQFLQQVGAATRIEAGLIRLLIAGITHSILTEDKQSGAESTALTEAVIRSFCLRLAPSETLVTE